MTIDLKKPYILITSEKGEQKVEAMNFRGKGCLQAVQAIQEQLGGTVIAAHNKPEFHSSPAVSQQATVKVNTGG
jgi:hypothetical protein